MKSVTATDAWRHVANRTRGFRAKSVSTSGKAPLADFEVDLPNGLVVVAGLNGVGKTTFLRLVANALGEVPRKPPHRDLNSGGAFEMCIEAGGADVVAPHGDTGGVRAVLLDAADESARLLAFAEQPNLNDLILVAGSRNWSEAEVREATYVVGKRYTSISVSEIENTTDTSSDGSALREEEDEESAADDPVLPFIEVTVDSVTYDIRTMGLGELAALVTLWRLRRVPSNSILLLEEPETYLAARGAVSLLNVVAAAVDKRRLYAIVTTHSPGLLRAAPVASVRLFKPTSEGVVLSEPSSSAEIEAFLDLPSASPRLILVEDATAEQFVKELVQRYGGYWAGRFEYLQTDGHERLEALCQKFPKTERLSIVGVLDGDQPYPTQKRNWPVLVLHRGALKTTQASPSVSADDKYDPAHQNTNPDRALRSAAEGNFALFASALGSSVDLVESSAHAHIPDEEHDWFKSIGLRLGVDKAAVVRAAIAVWLDDSGHRDFADELVQSLIAAFPEPR